MPLSRMMPSQSTIQFCGMTSIFGESEFLLRHDRTDQPRIVVHVQREKHDVLAILVLLDQFLQARRRPAAERSIQGPEVLKHYLAPQIGELPGFALQVGQLKGWQSVLNVLPSEMALSHDGIGAASVPAFPAFIGTAEAGPEPVSFLGEAVFFAGGGRTIFA